MLQKWLEEGGDAGGVHKKSESILVVRIAGAQFLNMYFGYPLRILAALAKTGERGRGRPGPHWLGACDTEFYGAG